MLVSPVLMLPEIRLPAPAKGVPGLLVSVPPIVLVRYGELALKCLALANCGSAQMLPTPLVGSGMVQQ